MNNLRKAIEKLGLMDGLSMESGPQVIEAMYQEWCKINGRSEHELDTDLSFQKVFGEEALMIIKLNQYLTDAFSSHEEYFEVLSSLESGHTLDVILPTIKKSSFVNAALKKKLLTQLENANKSLKQFEAEDTWDDKWNRFDDIQNDLEQELIHVAQRILEIDATEDEKDMNKWVSVASSILAKGKKEVPPLLAPAMAAFADYFDKHGDYPTTEQLVKLTGLKKQYVEEQYDEIEELFVSSRLD